MDLTLVLVSLLLSLSIIIFSHKFYLSKKIFDKANARSSHNVIATRSGGVATFMTLFIVSLTNYIIGNTLFDYSILIPLGILVAVGSYDDLYNVDFKLKFIFQIIAAKMIIDTGLLIDNFHGIMGLYEINRIFAQILTIFIIVSIINAINFIDGVDGLAISIVSIFIILFQYFSIDNTPYFNVSLILFSSILPLYYFNFKKKRKVFLGDAGTHFLGGLVSIYVIYILSNDYIIEPKFDLHKVLFVFSILSYPIIDLIRVFFLRIKNGKSPFVADKNHIHHIINYKVGSHLAVTSLISFSTIIIMLAIQFVF
tara:strand:- start:277 stop:1209 length:933 start_codon:yes stop_codon:yes gene_type:complete